MILWSSIFKSQRSTFFQILCVVWAKFFHILNATKLGKIELQEYEPRRITAILMTSKESQRNSSGIFSQGSLRMQLCAKISKSSEFFRTNTRNFHRKNSVHVNDISCDRKDNKDECLKNADFVKTFAKRFGIGQWSFNGPGSEKKWCPSENSPQGEWGHIAEDMLLRFDIAEDMLLRFAESGHSVFRATTPLSRAQLKSKGKGKVSIHFSADTDTIDTIYRIFLSVNQLSVYGAVAVFCDEYESHPDSTGQPVILEGQSIVLREVKAEALAREEPEDSNVFFCRNIINKLNHFHQIK